MRTLYGYFTKVYVVRESGTVCTHSILYFLVCVASDGYVWVQDQK